MASAAAMPAACAAASELPVFFAAAAASPADSVALSKWSDAAARLAALPAAAAAAVDAPCITASSAASLAAFTPFASAPVSMASWAADWPACCVRSALAEPCAAAASLVASPADAAAAAHPAAAAAVDDFPATVASAAAAPAATASFDFIPARMASAAALPAAKPDSRDLPASTAARAASAAAAALLSAWSIASRGIVGGICCTVTGFVVASAPPRPSSKVAFSPFACAASASALLKVWTSILMLPQKETPAGVVADSRQCAVTMVSPSRALRPYCAVVCTRMPTCWAGWMEASQIQVTASRRRTCSSCGHAKGSNWSISYDAREGDRYDLG